MMDSETSAATSAAAGNRELLGVAVEVLMARAALQRTLTASEIAALRATLERICGAEPPVRITERQREILQEALPRRRRGEGDMAPVLSPVQIERMIDVLGGAAIGMGLLCSMGMVVGLVLGNALIPAIGTIVGAFAGAVVGAVRGLNPAE